MLCCLLLTEEVCGELPEMGYAGGSIASLLVHRILMPQRGYGRQPRVAASATLGKESALVLNRNAVASALCISEKTTQPRCG